MGRRILLLLQLLCLVLFTTLATAEAQAQVQEPIIDDRPTYRAGEAIPVTCRKLILLY
jgi:hypothetical protein